MSESSTSDMTTASATAADDTRASAAPRAALSDRAATIITNTWLQQAQWSTRAGNFKRNLEFWRAVAAAAAFWAPSWRPTRRLAISNCPYAQLSR